MGRPTKDGMHEVERTETMRWLGLVRAQNPHLTLAEIEQKILPQSMDTENALGYKLGRYLSGRRAMSLDALKKVVQRARKNGLLIKHRSLRNEFDHLVDDDSKIRPSEEIADFNQKLKEHFRTAVALQKAWSEFVATAKDVSADLFLAEDKNGDLDDDFGVSDFEIKIPIALVHLGRIIGYPTLPQNGAKVVQSKPKAKVNETKSKSKKSI